MDQVACATGGAVTINFADPEAPVIRKIPVSFADWGLSLLVVDTGANHADLTHEYAAIPADMKAVAAALGGSVLQEIPEEKFVARIAELRKAIGDRAVSRAIHFYDENRRVEKMVEALAENDKATYLRLMSDSGRSSGIFLQNCVPSNNHMEQGVVLALALSERYFNQRDLKVGIDVAARVHGGGFAGTIQVLVPQSEVPAYTAAVEQHLGSGAVSEIGIRKTGAIAFPA
ncbi:MAG: hypothetical protein E4H09_01710 [Spirochaetales bacterium]|nr:MAG: hypothetical protein E4H09_01710 [Spirochaetales bacterium]